MERGQVTDVNITNASSAPSHITSDVQWLIRIKLHKVNSSNERYTESLQLCTKVSANYISFVYKPCSASSYFELAVYNFISWQIFKREKQEENFERLIYSTDLLTKKKNHIFLKVHRDVSK